MEIGIGITSRNRPHVLRIALQHFYKFSDMSNIKLVVVDDCSDNKFMKEYSSIKYKEYLDIVYYRNPKRLGIAKAKNECLKRLCDCKHIFLFDDDTFPKKEGWEELFINVNKEFNSIKHLMYLSDKWTKIDTSKTDGAIINKLLDHGSFSEYGNCFGICLYFTRDALELLGGYNPNFGIYGYEHAEISKRAEKLGLTGGSQNYLSPNNVEDFIYSFDTDYHFCKILPPLIDKLEFEFDSSINRKVENVKSYIAKNMKVWTQSDSLYYKV